MAVTFLTNEDKKEMVLNTPQSLTQEQQAQARTNLGILDEAKYYPSLSTAIADTNNNATTSALTDISAAKVKVFTAENGRLTVMLLDDVSENSQITINKDIDLVLNGKTLTFTAASAYIDIATDIVCNIYGEVSGSAIVKRSNSTGKASVRLINISAGELHMLGGRYANEGSESAITLRISGTAMVIADGCEIHCSSTGEAPGYIARAVQSTTSELVEFRNTKIISNAGYQSDGFMGMSPTNAKNCTIICDGHLVFGFLADASTKPNTHIALDNCNITATTHDMSPPDSADNGSAKGMLLSGGIVKLSNCKVLADAFDDNDPGTCSTGIRVDNNCTCFINGGNVFGTHSAIANGAHGKLYVSGGVFTGYSHGGFYFSHGVEGEAFVKDAVIRCGNYPTDGFFKDLYAVDGENNHNIFAGFYVATPGNSATTNGSTVYLDGCTIGYPGKTAFVLRGSSGEQNCTVNISNSTIVDGANQIRVDNATHKLNVGIGCNITTDKIDNPQWAEFTRLNYRKYNEDETVDGKDCAALQNQIESSVRFTEQALTPAQQAQARENIGLPVGEPAEDDVPKVFINGVIPTTKDDVLAEMEYISKTERFNAYLKIKCQGSSSMDYPKKNFTVKLYTDEARETELKKVFKDWGYASNKFVLKANYIDHSHARNIVCANLWDEVVSSRADYSALPSEMRNSPKNGAIDGFPVKVYTNGTYQGIYTWNIGKDDWMWGMDEDNANHVLLCAETNTDGVYSENASNFRALWSGTDEEDWSVEVGKNSGALKSSLNALISCVKDTDDATFKATISNHLDVQSAIDYYLHQYVIAGVDNLAKNMLLATYDGVKWICGAYDMDSTFGLTPQGGTSTVRANYACPEEYKEQFSLLWERIVNNFYEDIRVRYAELRKSVYSLGNIVTKFERFMDTIGTELFAEDATIYTIPSASTNNIKFIRNFVRDRLAYTDEKIPLLRYRVPATGLTLDRNSVVFGSFDPVTITARVTPSDATDAVVWTSGNEAVAIVDNGVVTPIAAGICTITARCNSYSVDCPVEIDPEKFGKELEWTDGYYLAGSTGMMESSNSEDTSSDFVNLLGATKFALFAPEPGSSLTSRIHYYDINKEYIFYVPCYENIDVDGKANVPENAAYVRLYSKTQYKNSVTYLTDTFRNGFVQPAMSGFVPNKKPSASGIVDAGNTIGYFEESIPVSEGQVVHVFNAYKMDYTGSDKKFGDVALYGFDADGNYVAISNINAGRNGQNVFVIPSGVTSVKIGAHNTSYEYMWYKVMDA